MVEKGKLNVGYLMESGILYRNAEVRVLNKDGKIIFSGMAWEMDDDILSLNLKHILSVYPTDERDKGKVWIEVYDEAPAIKPEMCTSYRTDKFCENCRLDKCPNWKQRRKSPHGGFVHEETDIYLGAVTWSPSTPKKVKDVFKK